MPLKPRMTVVQPSDESIRHIALTKNQFSVVDAEDYECINAFAWQAKWDAHTKQFRAERSIRLESGKRRSLGMHRQIMGDPEGLLVDHMNHNTLDNRKINLRTCTQSQNSMNRRVRSHNKLGLKGVSKMGNRYSAHVTTNGKKTYLGCFKSPELAYAEHIRASKQVHGEFSIFRD